MEEIIKITEKDGQKAVNARDLHQFLGSKRQFADWIKQRIEQYGFVENQDYCSFHKIVKRETGATTITEYALTLDMAKELSMVENNEKGRMARKYFIECEKVAIEQTTPIQDKLAVADWMMKTLNYSEVAKLQLVNSIVKPYGLPVPDYVPAKNGAKHSAKELLKLNNAGISAIKFNKIALAAGFLELKTRKGTSGNHKFYSISDKGAEYGENDTSLKNPNQTQPHWYDDKFQELLRILLLEQNK